MNTSHLTPAQFAQVWATAKDVTDMLKTQAGIDNLRGLRWIDPLTYEDMTPYILARAYHNLMCEKALEQFS